MNVKKVNKLHYSNKFETEFRLVLISEICTFRGFQQSLCSMSGGLSHMEDHARGKVFTSNDLNKSMT